MVAFAVLTLLSSQSHTEAIKQVFKSAVDEGKFRGLVQVSLDDKVVFEKSAGPANQYSIKPSTLIPICSITKQFVAVAILQAAGQGSISLQDPIGKYLEWLPAFAKPVTIRQLLTHSSGLPNMDKSGTLTTDGVATTYFKTDKSWRPLRDRILKLCGDKLEFQPGEKFSYNNLDFIILSALVEKITNKPFENHIKDSLLKLLGLKNTAPAGWGPLGKRVVLSYDTVDGKDIPETRFNFGIYSGAGEYLSTAEDLGKWGRSLMSSNVSALFKDEPTFGFVVPGSFVYNVKVGEETVRVLDRAGAIANYSHDLLLDPKHKVVVLVLSNWGRSDVQLAYTGGGLPLNLLRAAVTGKVTE